MDIRWEDLKNVGTFVGVVVSVLAFAIARISSKHAQAIEFQALRAEYERSALELDEKVDALVTRATFLKERGARLEKLTMSSEIRELLEDTIAALEAETKLKEKITPVPKEWLDRIWETSSIRKKQLQLVRFVQAARNTQVVLGGPARQAELDGLEDILDYVEKVAASVP
jgi:hypothetical protein